MMRNVIVGGVILAVGLSAAACGHMADMSDSADDRPVSAEKPFAAGGTIEMHLSGGEYEVRAGGDRVRVETRGHTGGTKVDVATEGKTATVNVSDTPHNNFHASIEVPKSANLVIRLTAGELRVAPISGNLDVDSTAGNVTIEVVNADDYAKVDASVKAGDLKAEAFGQTRSGLMQQIAWSGPGTHTLRANLGAGNLIIRR